MSFSSASGRENNVRKLSFLGFNTKKKVSNNHKYIICIYICI